MGQTLQVNSDLPGSIRPAVIGSAVVPPLVANGFYLRRHLLPGSEDEAGAPAEQTRFASGQAE